ncbi:hypothetical protein [Streptomyces sp. PBH53]|uniref:hypothetical protein n=1 Tax=Streptomyces sp. PBH53 TaxID=1577075 RepID=UPI0028FC788A|nr:hypothetical protein [Streptomyces sp. PBH53]
MTPRRVTVMTVTSRAVLGALGSLLGVPLAIAAHRIVVPRMAAGVDLALPRYMTDVWHAPLPTVLALTGAGGDRRGGRAAPRPPGGPPHRRRGAAHRVTAPTGQDRRSRRGLPRPSVKSTDGAPSGPAPSEE